MAKNTKPLVTVIIPIFNRLEYFKLALESALNQTYKKIEVIVSDNSTNDETEKLITLPYCRFANKIFPPQQFFS